MFTARPFVLDLSLATLVGETVRASNVASSSKTTTTIKG